MNSAIRIGGEEIAPGEARRVEIPAARLTTHTMLHLPVTVVNGRRDGAHLWLSAALHGNELNGIEIVRRVLERVTPNGLRGVLLAVPIVNVFGFINQSRYMPDRRDLNRSFPGSASGSLASRMARLFMKEIVARSTHGLDLHTAAPPRTNLPQIRGNMRNLATRRLARAFAAPLILHATASKGTLRQAATRRGIPTLLYEAGDPLRFNSDAIEIGVNGVLRVMAELKMIESRRLRKVRPSIEAQSSKWVRARQSGVFYLTVNLGQRVRAKQPLGRITDPFGEAAKEVASPITGVVIGHTNNPLVHRGDGIVHIAATR